MHARDAWARHRTARGWRHAASLACADDGSWPEPGFCLFDVERRSVLALARRYRQHAIVGAKLGAVPRLLWTTPAALRRPERAWHRCARDHDPARCDRGSPA
ncbi:DUF3293 domain-containing protein [Solimonas terrae]|uniref:DUF3293 domain-containing protein n=1 Tax=Solimonas terrae TaxID=1396819 RepID=A0A6M2BL91_9GAMM|nr:DUF3293 domain-containing protein [Solimonas terrae]